jgi:hypothetical protein
VCSSDLVYDSVQVKGHVAEVLGDLKQMK